MRRELELCYGLGGRRGLYEEKSFEGKFSQRYRYVQFPISIGKWKERTKEKKKMAKEARKRVKEKERGHGKIGGYHRYLGQRRGERFSVCSNRIDSTR